MAKRDGTVDLRIKRTQKSIKNAFYELIEEKGFDHISVKDITERAMISRNTFYLHYNDKFDLLTQKLQQGIRRALDLISSDIDGISEYSLQYIISGTCGIIKYQVTHESSNIADEAYRFAEIHFGGLIEALQESKRNGEGN